MRVLWVLVARALLATGGPLRERRETPGETDPRQPAMARSANIAIWEKYPAKPRIVLQRGVSTEFFCASTEPWNICTWNSPIDTEKPCVMLEDTKRKQCDDWTRGGNFEIVQNATRHRGCSIHTSEFNGPNNEGTWSCILHDTHFNAATASFEVEYLKPAIVSLKAGSVTSRDAEVPNEEEDGSNRTQRGTAGDVKTELRPGDELELTCRTRLALPEPTIQWFMGFQQIDFDSDSYVVLVEDEKPKSSSQGGTFSSMQKIRYTAREEHNSYRITCKAQQFDDESNENIALADRSVNLLIREELPESPVSLEMIGSIIGFIIILCLALILLFLAWYFDWFCFSKNEKLIIRGPEFRPALCPGCKDTNPLLSHNHNHTCEMATQQDGEDQVNRISKYQTEIILVTDKLVNNPGSDRTVDDFSKLTDQLQGLMEGMAGQEADDGLKNRFLMAAQGLSSSVAALVGAAEQSAATPHGEAERRLARAAGEEVKSTVTQSVNTIRRIHAMKDLSKMVEAAVATAKENHDVATEVVEGDPASHDTLIQTCGEAAKATNVLEQALAFYIQNPTSARAQTNLLVTTRGFLTPAQGCLDRCRAALPELVYDESREKLQGTSDKFTATLKQLETTVEDTELCVDSLATEEAAEVVRFLLAEVEAMRAEATKGCLKLQPGESAEKAAEDVAEMCGAVRTAGADCLISSLAGDRPGMDQAARQAVDALGVMKTAVRAAAAGAKDRATQAMVLDSGLAVMEQADQMLTAARKTVLNPANPVAAGRQVEAGEGLSQAVAVAVLASAQDGNLKATQRVADELNQELEQFREAVNAFRVKPIPGVLIESVSNKLDRATDEVNKNVADLVGSALRVDEFGSEEAARYVALSLDAYKNAVRAVVNIVTDKQVQETVLVKGQAVLARAGRLAQEAGTVLAQPGNAEAGRALQSSAADLTAAMKSLEQVYMYGAPGQEQFVSALNIMKHATKELQNPTPTEKREDVGQLKTRMMTATKEIAGLAHDIQTTAHTDPGEMDGLTFLAQKYKNLASDINQLMEQAEDAEEGQATLDTVTSLGHSILHLIEGTAGHQVRPGQAALLEIANHAQAVATNSVQTLSSVNSLARRAQAMDIIGKHLAGVLHNLDTTIMFASAGTLNVEDEGDTFAGQREDILRFAQVLVTDVQAVLSGTASTKSELITASEQSLGNMQQLAERIKAAASCLGPENMEAQVMLLNTAKDVCGSLVDLIHQAKTANGQSLDHPAYGQVKNLSKNVIVNITSLLKSVKTFEDESSRGSRAMESSVAAIGQELQLFRSGEGAVVPASPEELLRANRAITQATSKAVAAASSGRQDDLLAVANIGRRAIAELLQTCRGAAEASDDQELKAEILAKGEQLAVQYQQLLQQVAAGAGKETLVELSRTVAHTATTLAQLAERLKGKDLVNPEDPIIIAETELLNAAESIEQAALKLSKLVKRGQGAEQKDLENMTFNELIIDSAQSIAKATSSLIKAATEAQRELVAKGKVTAETVVGSEAGQWSEGLVSAAKLVASATRSLCEAANNLVTGEGGEEHLIAAAKAVSKSTAQLVLACKVKADGWETSAAMIGLNTASIAVRKATDALVKAARGSIEREDKSKVKVDIYKEMIEADAKVIRLQKEVSEGKIVEADMKEQSQITGKVSDIKKARDAENEVQALARDLEHAINYKARLNERQYNTLSR